MSSDSHSNTFDSQRTRAHRPLRRDETDRAASQIGNTQRFSVQPAGGLFDGLSLAQVIAGAAAAATSVLLASRIGIAGSVIGAAVSSVVTVVSSQLYRRFLTASANKIKAASWVPDADARKDAQAPEGKLTQRLYDAVEGAAPGAAPSGTRIAPESLQRRAEAERRASQRKVIVFSLVAAIVALALSAGVILAATAGEGLGTRTEPIFAPRATSEETAGTGEPQAGVSNGTAAGNKADGTASSDADAPVSSTPDAGSDNASADTPADTGTGSTSGDASGSDGASSGGSTGSGSADAGTSTGGSDPDSTGSDTGTTTDTGGNAAGAPSAGNSRASGA